MSETMIDSGETPEQPAGSTESTDWRAHIPEDLKDEPSLADIQDIASLAKGYVHAQHMVGADKVVLPGADATDEEKAEFFGKLGRPDTAEGYEMPGENMPEGVTLDQELTATFFAEAHRIGLNKSQAAALIRWQAEVAAESATEQTQKYEQTKEDAGAALRKEYGPAFEQNIDLAQRAAMQFGGSELVQLLNATGLGNEPAIIKAFAKIGRSVSEDEIVGGGGRQGFLMSPGEAKAAIGEKKRDGQFMEAYMSRANVGHAEAVEEMTRLHGIAYPDPTE